MSASHPKLTLAIESTQAGTALTPRTFLPAVTVESVDGSERNLLESVDGLDGVDVELTPEAALETSDRLLDGAATAVGQRVQAEHAKGDGNRD